MKFKSKVLAGLTVSLFAVSAINAAEPASAEVRTIGGPVTPYHFSGDLRDLPIAASWQPGDPIKEVPRRNSNAIDPQSGDYKMSRDPLADLQKLTTANSNRAFDTPIINIDGQGFTGVNPPDTVGDIGKDYYIQSINGGGGSIFTVYDKTDGSVVAGPISMETLAPSGNCTTASGDPIILYDEVAERWFMQEFVNNGSNTLCFYISATDDPVTGGWNFYEFVGATFPDYPHFGVWADAYLGTANEATSTVYVFDRANMITGGVARPAQAVILGDLPGYGFQTATPVDWDGIVAPPAGAPGIFMRHIDEEAHGTFTNNPTTDLLEMWEFVVDFDNSANSSFTQIPDITITDFNSWYINYSVFASVPQPGGGGLLDPIREVILNRLQYRNFGSYEVILGTLPTNINPATSGSVVNAGLRWFELRRTNAGVNPDVIFANGFDLPTAAPWVLHQEGTYDPGSSTENRLVGSVSMDSAGNIALAYTKTDTDVGSPIPASIAYTGRLASDANDVMTQAEVLVKLGTGVQGSGRWGDYAAMGVDPIDGCTFWFTGEYQNGASWGTSISSFKFDACGAPGFLLSSSETTHDVCVLPGSVNINSTINVISISGFTNDVTLAFNPALPATFTGSLTPSLVTPGNTSDLALTVGNTTPAGPYTVTVEGTATGADDKLLDFNINVVDALPGMTTLTLPVDAATLVPVSAVAYAWDTAVGASEYTIEIATDAAFTTIVETATVTTNSHTSTVDLPSSSDIYWRVTVSNSCGNGVVSATFSFTTISLPGDCPTGLSTVNVESYDFESGDQGWTHSSLAGTDTWALGSGNPHGGTQAWHADDIAAVSDQVLVSPTITLPIDITPLTLQFWNRQELEDRTAGGCWDAGILEISTDAGATFTQIVGAELLTDPYDGAIQTDFSNPLGGIDGWCGDPQEYLNSIVNLDAYAGQDVSFRFRLGTDSSVSHPGWDIDDISVQGCN